MGDSEIQSDGATGLSEKFRLGIWFLQYLGRKELLSGVNVPKKTEENDVLVDGTSGVEGACGDIMWVNVSVFVWCFRCGGLSRFLQP